MRFQPCATAFMVFIERTPRQEYVLDNFEPESLRNIQLEVSGRRWTSEPGAWWGRAELEVQTHGSILHLKSCGPG